MGPSASKQPLNPTNWRVTMKAFKILFLALTVVSTAAVATTAAADVSGVKVAPYQGNAQMSIAATPDNYVHPVTGGDDQNMQSASSKEAHQFDARPMENNQNGQ